MKMKIRITISAKIKLHIKLSYLAIGNSFRNLAEQSRVSRPAISIFVPEGWDAINEVLKKFTKISTYIIYCYLSTVTSKSIAIA